jgi:hypothetical protein
MEHVGSTLLYVSVQALPSVVSAAPLAPQRQQNGEFPSAKVAIESLPLFLSGPIEKYTGVGRPSLPLSSQVLLSMIRSVVLRSRSAMVIFVEQASLNRSARRLSCFGLS